jgi:hypothetical protein
MVASDGAVKRTAFAYAVREALFGPTDAHDAVPPMDTKAIAEHAASNALRLVHEKIRAKFSPFGTRRLLCTEHHSRFQSVRNPGPGAQARSEPNVIEIDPRVKPLLVRGSTG